MFEVFLSQQHHQLWTFRPSQPVISKDSVTSFLRKKRKKIEKFEKSMIFGCFLTFLASIIIVESLKTIKHPKTVWIWRKNHFSKKFDKKNVPLKKTSGEYVFFIAWFLTKKQDWMYWNSHFPQNSQPWCLITGFLLHSGMSQTYPSAGGNWWSPVWGSKWAILGIFWNS